MNIIPCKQNADLHILIDEYSEALKTDAHKLGNHGLSEVEFYSSGLFRGAIERIRGQFSATMREKWDFAALVFGDMQDRGFIMDWESAGDANRHDYAVTLNSGRIAVIELKGCLDGNNTNIFERPAHANEFVIWGMCINPGSDPRRNVWSGIHTRLSAEIISHNKQVDGLVIWDMVCGTVGRPCPKLAADPSRVTEIGSFVVPPPCIYLFPATVPAPRNNPHPSAQTINNVEILKAFHDCYGGRDDELNFVDFEVEHKGPETVRTTTVNRAGIVVRKSKATAIRRS